MHICLSKSVKSLVHNEKFDSGNSGLDAHLARVGRARTLWWLGLDVVLGDVRTVTVNHELIVLHAWSGFSSEVQADEEFRCYNSL